MKVLIIVHDGESLSDNQQLAMARAIRKSTSCHVCQMEQMDFDIVTPVQVTENEEEKAYKEAFKVIDLNFRDAIRKKVPLLLAIDILKYTSKHKEDNPVSIACDVICRAKKTQEFYTLAEEYGLNRDQISAIISAIKD